MKTLMMIIGLVIFSAACATPYKADGFRGGYTDIKVGKNKYLVSFRGNGYTSNSTVQQYAFQRAREVCKEQGFDDFDLVNKVDNSDVHRNPSSYHCNYSNGFGGSGSAECSESPGMTWTKHKVEIIVQCIKDSDS